MLKGDREVINTNVRFKIEDNKAAERGTVLVASATDGIAAVPGTTLAGDERPLGILLDDVEDLDYTKQPEILSRNVVPFGSNVALLVKGRVRTNMIDTAATPAPGSGAYLAANGKVTTGSGIKVGFFESEKDADGYAYLFVDIQGGN